MPPRRPQDAPRRPQDDPKTPQDAPKMAPRRSKTPPGRPKTPQDAPRPPQDAPKPPKTIPRQRFWDDLNESLEDFWEIFWKIFGRFFGRICRPTCLLNLAFFDPNWRQVEIWTTMETTETENLGERRRLPKRKNRLLSPLRSLGPGKPGGVSAREARAQIHISTYKRNPAARSTAGALGGNRAGCQVPAPRAPRNVLLMPPRRLLIAFFFGIRFSMPFLTNFSLIFHPNLPPKIHPNRSKIN